MRQRMMPAALLSSLALLAAAGVAAAQPSRAGSYYSGGPYYGGYGRSYSYGRPYYGSYGRSYSYGMPYYGRYGMSYSRGVPYYGSYGRSYSYGRPYYGGYGRSYSRGMPYYSMPYASSPGTYYGSPGQQYAPPGGEYEAEPAGSRAWVRVIVPSSNAEVFFDDSPTRQRGTERLFVANSLPEGEPVRYTVKATWSAEGRPMSREKEVVLRPGETTVVRFRPEHRAAKPPILGEADAVVRMTGTKKFEPGKVTISVGDTVEWVNESRMVHTVTADPDLAKDRKHVQLPPAAKPFHSGDVPPGKKYHYTFSVPGTYRYFCVPHEADGMLGEIEVKPAGE